MSQWNSLSSGGKQLVAVARGLDTAPLTIAIISRLFARLALDLAHGELLTSHSQQTENPHNHRHTDDEDNREHQK